MQPGIATEFDELEDLLKSYGSHGQGTPKRSTGPEPSTRPGPAPKMYVAPKRDMSRQNSAVQSGPVIHPPQARESLRYIDGRPINRVSRHISRDSSTSGESDVSSSAAMPDIIAELSSTVGELLEQPKRAGSTSPGLRASPRQRTSPVPPTAVSPTVLRPTPLAASPSRAHRVAVGDTPRSQSDLSPRSPKAVERSLSPSFSDSVRARTSRVFCSCLRLWRCSLLLF
eukprot:TRINITY_DN1345_c0_g1_i2.p1 TRINITY_DN1345_c0_g1~~TRINITY_DN1345_c0_g1_i2.p1  ORF type:complete len:227 (+),score=38.02 TRINITY_DN1345_c0_g1_i2:175-855(+)